jgi:mannan endo-1,4-beta-mannosidase
MQHATGYGVGWENDDDRSDIKDVCGDFPAIYGEDLREVLQDDNVDRIRYRIISAYERGAVITVCWHQLDPDFRGWNSEKVNHEKIVTQILPGGARHSDYVAKLRITAEFFKSLRGKNGEAIPVIFRPYHEHLGSWFWWGVGHCTVAEFNKLWRFTVDCLHNSMNVHNLLWAISPDLKFLDKGDDYFKRFPGDDYVDIYGIDFYYHTPLNNYVVADYRRRLNNIVELALKHDKIPALTEIGQDGLDDINWHTRTMINPIKHDSLNIFIAYGVTWRNAGPSHFHVPYRGHAAVPDFLDFYNDPYTLFDSDLPDMYSLPEDDRKAPVVTLYPDKQIVSSKTSVTIELETEERALLRWSYEDEDFDLMPNRFQSGQPAFQHTTFIASEQESQNIIYVRAKDIFGNKTKQSIQVAFAVDTLQAVISWSDPLYSVDSWSNINGSCGSGVDAIGSIKEVKTAYLVKDIELSEKPTGARIIVRYNGGFVLYVNGTEAFRYNLPGEMELYYDTQPLTIQRNTKAVTLDAKIIDKLKTGKNRITIAIHGGSRNVECFDALFQTDIEMPFYYGSEWSYYDLGNKPKDITLGEIMETAPILTR